MPNILDAFGLQVNTFTETQQALIDGFKSIYGADINVQSNSPDGQLIGILSQLTTDQLNFLVQVYNSFSLDNAFGTVLDQRVSLVGIHRKLGSYTEAVVAVTTTQALNLVGLDALISNPSAVVFTVADNAGNQYYLKNSYSFGAAGTVNLTFRAATIGAVLTVPNTIQTIVTTQLGVTSVNNPTTSGDVTGLPQETDPQLKIRAIKSFMLQAVGPSDSIRAALLSYADILDAYVVENDSGSPVAGVPAHSVWVIVNGGTAAEIARAIYAKKSAGCGMKGGSTQNVTRPEGGVFTAQWDPALTQPLYIQATLVPRIPGLVFDLTLDAQRLAAALNYKLGQSPSIGDIVLAMAVIEPNAVLSNVQVSLDGMTWQDIVSPTTAQYYFTVSSGNIALT